MSKDLRLQQSNIATKKKLLKWSTLPGLDITDDAGFRKHPAKESRFKNDKRKHNLKLENLRRYTEELVLKVNPISAVEEFTIHNAWNR